MVKNITELIPDEKNVAQNWGLLFSTNCAGQSKLITKRRKFAQSGHPAQNIPPKAKKVAQNYG
jgi:hypothetical protein